MSKCSDLPEAPVRWACGNCGWVCADADVLEAPNPFNPDFKIYGCPSCKEVGELEGACYVEGCGRRWSGGYPGGHGYRYVWTCSEHAPEKSRSGEEN